MAWRRRVRSEQLRQAPEGAGAPWEVFDASLPTLELFVWREMGACMVAWEPSESLLASLPDDARWFIERSASPFGPFQSLVGQLDPALRQWRDDGLPAGRTNTRAIYYRVGWESAEDPGAVFGLFSDWQQWPLQGQPDPVAGVSWDMQSVAPHKVPGVVREIRARFDLYLHHLAGTTALLYRPDWLTGRGAHHAHPTTGTLVPSGLLGNATAQGYTTPIRVLFAPGSSSRAVVQAQATVSDLVERVGFEAPWWPPLQLGDVFRTLEGRIFEITSLNPLDHLGHVGQYGGELTEVPRTHPINSLPMPPGFREQASIPRRQAGMIMNLEALAPSQEAGAMSRASARPPVELDPDPDA